MENELAAVIIPYTLVKVGLIAFLAMYVYNALLKDLESQQVARTGDTVNTPGCVRDDTC